MIRRTKKNKSRKGGKRPMTILSNPSTERTFRIVRTRNIAPQLLAAAAVTSVGYSWKLNDLATSSELTSLFDLYRIAKIDVQISSTVNAQGFSAGSVSVIPRIATVIDYNSAGTFATFDDAGEFQSCRIMPLVTGANSIKFTIRPRFLGVAEDSSTSVVVASNNAGWLNTAAANIPHYGLRWIAEQAGSATISVLVSFRYHLELTAVK